MNTGTNIEQLESLHLVISAGLNHMVREEMAEKLLYEIVDGFNERIRRRLKKHANGSRITGKMTLTSIEAKALYCWYQNMQHTLEGPYKYECLIGQTLIDKIHKEYA